MKKLFIMLLIIMFITIPSMVSSLVPGVYDLITHWAYNGNSVTLGWTASAGADSYDIKVEHAETEQLIDVGSTVTLNITYQLPKMGHYIFRVRAVNIHGASDWAVTTNPEHVAGGIGFWVYSQIPPVGGVVID